jgi:hypothetical protein
VNNGTGYVRTEKDLIVSDSINNKSNTVLKGLLIEIENVEFVANISAV